MFLFYKLQRGKQNLKNIPTFIALKCGGTVSIGKNYKKSK